MAVPHFAVNELASFFIIAMVGSSLISRALRSTELRISGIQLDGEARELLADDDDRVIRVIARRPKVESEEELDLRSSRAAIRVEPYTHFSAGATYG